MTTAPHHTEADTAPAPLASKREGLIELILDFQSRYRYQGAVQTRESLGRQSTAWLERMNNLQIVSVTCNGVAARGSHTPEPHYREDDGWLEYYQ